MCFTKSAPVIVTQPKDPVVQHEADASLTKNSKSQLSHEFNENVKTSAFAQNIKTSALGLDEQAKTQKKTLLGE